MEDRQEKDAAKEETSGQEIRTPVPAFDVRKIFKAPIRTFGRAIRAKCLDCACGSQAEIRSCPIELCPLFPFRFGRNPYRPKKEYSEEERARLAEHLRQIRLGKAQEDGSAMNLAAIEDEVDDSEADDGNDRNGQEK